MKRTLSILATATMAAAAWAQNPAVINNVQSTMNQVQQQKTADSDAALDAAGVPKQTPAKPAAQATPGATQTKPAAAKGAATPATVKPATASGTAATVKPAAQTSSPGTASASKAPVVKPITGSTTKSTQAHDPMVQKTAQAKAIHARPAKTTKKTGTAKIVAVPAAKPAAPAPPVADASKAAEAPKPPKQEDKKWAMTGSRDPFFSPVVQQPTGSGCSTGKKCLEIGAINLRGVVRSDDGFIAIVTNNLNKAYYLRENDPVFNGYVVKSTGDSVVFSETVLDKLGKSSTREVVKRIFTPAV